MVTEEAGTLAALRSRRRTEVRTGGTSLQNSISMVPDDIGFVDNLILPVATTSIGGSDIAQGDNKTLAGVVHTGGTATGAMRGRPSGQDQPFT